VVTHFLPHLNRDAVYRILKAEGSRPKGSGGCHRPIGFASLKWRAVWSLFGQPFELNRAEVVERRMTPDGVIEVE
jgi:hypothetical protein